MINQCLSFPMSEKKFFVKFLPCRFTVTLKTLLDRFKIRKKEKKVSNVSYAKKKVHIMFSKGMKAPVFKLILRIFRPSLEENTFSPYLVSIGQ